MLPPARQVTDDTKSLQALYAEAGRLEGVWECRRGTAKLCPVASGFSSPGIEAPAQAPYAAMVIARAARGKAQRDQEVV